MSKDWIDFYQNEDVPTFPTSFAQFVIPFIDPSYSIVDMGAGNKRDTNYFRSFGYTTIPVDPYGPEKEVDIIRQESFEYEIEEDVVYSRFLLHTLGDPEINDLIQRTPKMFISESRAIGDTPKLYPYHERNFTDPLWLFDQLRYAGFQILFFQNDRGLAKYKNEDPLVVRIIATR